jgi:hypothetical protein
MTLKESRNAGRKQQTAHNVVPITSVLESLRQENTRLHILYAQLQKDMESMRKKYERVEAEKEKLREENRILLSAVDVLKAENQQLRRTIFGQSAEKAKAAGHEQTNTTALPEGTACGGTDEDTTEAAMAEGASEADIPPEGATAEQGTDPHNRKTGEKIPRPNNIRRQMEENLPTVHYYPLSKELVRKLDEMYGKGQWRMLDWEGTAHLVHVPEIYVNQIDYVPVICLKDGTPRRPFTEHPEEFPTSILPHSVLSPSEFANVIHKKIAMGIPLYRQEQDMLQMCGVHLGRQDMADWMIRAGTQGFLQVYEYLIRQERACEYHSIDETFLQVILDGRAASTKSYLWAHRTGELANPEHPIVVFIYEPTRATEHLRKYFPEDIAAMISCDHYIAYETLESERDNIHIALCWMHVRRRFFYAFDLVANISDLSEDVVRESLEARLLMKIGEIYREEMKLKDLLPADRKAGRNQNVRSLINEFFEILHALDPDDPGLTKTLRDAVKYALDGEEKLKRFLDDPSIPIDNGSAERIIRKVATGRRAWLFCDTPDGPKALSLFYSLVATAQLNGANDYCYIKYLCEHVPGGLLGPIRQLTDEELEVLMPWSEEYKAYEKHEIETRYDALFLGNDMQKPTKADFLEIRRQIEEEDSTAGTETHDNSKAPASILDGQSGAAVEGVFNSNISGSALSDENELVEMPAFSDDPVFEGAEQDKPPTDQQNDLLSDFRCPEEQRKTG